VILTQDKGAQNGKKDKTALQMEAGRYNEKI
jgi:hypothetical protein